MLGLKLREEFLGQQMRNAAIELSTSDDEGAAQKPPNEILSITYPTTDVQIALKAISQKRTGHPIILMGGRGRGKSHIMAVMHHAIKTPEIVDKWLDDWASELETVAMRDIHPIEGFVPISEPVHNYEYPLLWELLFDRHPKGEYFSGQFALMKQPFPPRTLLESMFEAKPTCLILDEFQTWYVGLPDKDPKTGYLLKQWAYNFIQNLSEIATDRPEILILVISVLDNQNDAFQQLHRQSPVLIDFHGPTAKEDRKRLLMHRLFENRRQIAPSQINDVAGVYGDERIRLLHQDKTEVEKQRLHSETFECWPFSPELLDLLEDHILLSQAAQETRDLIRILAQVYKSQGNIAPVITPADFSVDGSSEEVQTLVDSIADQVSLERLREIAQRNLEAVTDAGDLTPHARGLLSSIWMRSLTPGPSKGGRPVDLHLDITRDQAVDDNVFQAEMAILVETSFNIHSDDAYGGRLWFGINENPRSKVRASAKNDKLWQIGAVVSGGQSTYPCKDIDYIRDTMRHILSPETSQAASRAIVLGPKWRTDPWNEVDELEKPGKWDRPILLVIPEQINSGTETIDECLGRWLAEHVNKRRNTVRFLMPASGNIGLFQDKDLINLARCSYLCSISGWGADATYKALHQEFDRPFRQLLEKM